MKILNPTPIDWRDRRFSFEKHFGATTTFAPEYNADIGQWMQDQNADSRPSACTAYTVVDLCSNEDGFRYSEDFNYRNTLELMNVPPNHEGADLRTAAKVPCSIGLIPRDDEPAEFFSRSQAWAATPSFWPVELNTEATKNQKPAYLPVSPSFQDWFDSVRSALVTGIPEKRVVGVGMRWSPDFEKGIWNGILPENPTNLYWGHAFSLVGWKQLGGQTYLIAKTWQGKNYGDNGYCYFSRSLFNRMMSEWGTYAFVIESLPTGTPAELKNRIMTLTDVIAMLLAYVKNTAYGLSQALH